jgi:hypothetical protein
MRLQKVRVRALPTPPAPLPSRRETRFNVHIRTWMKLKGRRYAIELLDLSDHGFGARTDAQVPIGGEIRLWLPGKGEVRAQVRWALCGVFGARLLVAGETEETAVEPEEVLMASEVLDHEREPA